MKQNIYDNKNFSGEYDKMRKEKKGYNANDLIEIPTFRSMLPNVKNKSILDLGCGYGETDKYLKELGATYVLGIDISEHMIDIANKENKIDGLEYKVMPMEEINAIDKKFDIIISSLAFHYIKDYNKLIKDIYNLLDENGILLFSQEHPMVLATIKEPYVSDSKIDINNKRFYLLSDYNRSGIREMLWNGEKVIKYHRTISELINGLVDAGFIIDEIKEPTPSEEAIEKVPKYIYQYDRPYFIFIKAHK